MKLLTDDRMLVSASDLNNHLACRHLTTLDLARARGELDATPSRSETAELLSGKGDEHEDAYLGRLREEGREVVEVPFPADSSLEALRRSADETVDAMRPGAEIIYQGAFFNGDERGHADFLFRVERPSDLGGWSYEVADTKLAKNPKPYHLIQLCFYSEMLAAVQGSWPEHAHVVLGTGEIESYRLAEFSAYYRRTKQTFLARIRKGASPTYPIPVGHCDICHWGEHCAERRERDDHLSLVAGIQRRQVELFEGAGINRLEALGELPASTKVPGIRPETLTKLRTQARLQLQGRRNAEPLYELRDPEPERGLARLPEPSSGDIFFDFEGDPFYEDRGLEYLWGYVTVDGTEPEFTALWARDYVEERHTFERFIDFVTERRRQHLGLHIYHYAPYEVTALKRLAGTHATRELELDQLLRDEVFVDLYKVVREGLVISQPSYSIKKLEAFYMEARETEVVDGGASVVEFERWVETRDDTILEAIADYNRDDCISTLKCRDWLLGRRDEAQERFGLPTGWASVEVREPSDEAVELYEQNAALREALTAGVPDDPAARDRQQQASWLMAQLVDYHQREARPAWWAYFERFDFSDLDEFIDDPESIGGLGPDETTPPRQEKRSLVHRLRFPPQETKLGGGTVFDPVTEVRAGTLAEVRPAEGWLELKRGPKMAGVPLPVALVPGGPVGTKPQRAALRVLASEIAESATEAGDRFSAARDMLAAAPPRLRGVDPGEPLAAPDADITAISAATRALDSSYLFIQGPPGAGKTYTASHVICDLIAEGRRVGVTANSHKAIHNLLHAVEAVARERGLSFRGLKKCGSGGSNSFESKLENSLIESTDDDPLFNDPGVLLGAGTAWHFCREDVDPIDYLFIDEAGQISIADALALATGAENVILLGDPQQLPQVTQGRHPAGAGISILEHLLAGHQTIPPDRGIFLGQTWRLNPGIASFVSELMYEGRLGSAPGMEHQGIEAPGDLSGSGLRWLPVEHENRSQSSPEEADAVAAAIQDLLGSDATFTDPQGHEHPLTAADILVVSPYNAHVRCLKDRLPAAVSVGTVDKFQGQEAQVVFFSMATSTGEDIPRNIEFLFSLNRLNVAISRARALAVLVASPRLLELEAKTIEQMRLANAVCRFVEVAARAMRIHD